MSHSLEATSSRNSSTSDLGAIITPEFSRNSSHTSSSATSVNEEPLCSADVAAKLSPAPSTSLSFTLDELIRTEGGGSWPPNPTYRDSWPRCLHIYDDVARLAPPRFVTPELRPNYTDAELRQRIDENRLWLDAVLQSADVQQVMLALPQLSVNARLGFLACTAYLVHLYRWGTLPVVAMAQDEKSILFPDTIASPFNWLNRYYGIESSGGCLFSMTLVNVIGQGEDLEMAYANMRHMPQKAVVDAERYNAFVFYQMESHALGLYRSIAQCQTYLARGQEQEAADALKQGHTALKAAFRHFFDTLKDDKIKKEVWMSHAQGFHGWGVDDFDGVSGDHSLLIRTLDAFLDIPLQTQPECPFATAQVPVKEWDAVCPVSGAKAGTASPATPAPGLLSRLYNWMWSSPTTSTSTAAATKLATVPCVGQKRMKEIRFSEVPYSNDYLPRGQVNWIRSVREARLRALASTSPTSPVALEMNEMLKTFKLWRMGHTRKAVYYEDLNLPERKPMTASGGVGGGVAEEGEGLAQMMEKLEARLRARISATK